MSRRFHTALRHLAIAAFVLVPLLVMSVFPQGTMAARGAGGMEIVLCTGDGPLTVLVDQDGTPIEMPGEGIDCGWSLLAQSLYPPEATSAVPPGRIAATQIRLPAGDLSPRDRAAAPYPARGPPSA